MGVWFGGECGGYGFFGVFGDGYLGCYEKCGDGLYG